MDNIVGGIRSRFFRNMSEITDDDDESAQRKPQKTSSRKEERKSRLDEEQSPSRSSGRRSRSRKRLSFGRGSRFLTSRPSYSSDDSSDISSDIEAVVAAAALAVSIQYGGESTSGSSEETSPVPSQTKPWRPLAPIGKDPSRSRRHYDEDVITPADSRAFVPSTSMERQRPGTPQSRDGPALLPAPSRKDSRRQDSCSDRWDRQRVPSRSGTFDERERSGKTSRSSTRESSDGVPRSSSRGKESRPHEEMSIHQSKNEKREAKANAWLHAQIAKIEESYRKKNSEIQVWEDKRRGQAIAEFKEIERQLMAKRMSALERKDIAIENSHKKAESERQKVNTRREAKLTEARMEAENIRRTGRVSLSFCCKYFTM